jgi:CheY-like chemotaxis protein
MLGSAIVFTDAGLVSLHLAVAERTGDEVELVLTVHSEVGEDVPTDKINEVLQPKTRPQASRESGKHVLGLAIAAELAEIMGGRMWREEEREHELKIHCSVRIKAKDGVNGHTQPAVGKARESSHQLATDLAERVPLRILLAEDTEVNQMLMTRLFAKMGYKLDVANNGREAVALSRSRSYDLILMDIQMPEMDGWEASSIILQESKRSQRPRIVAVTANASDENRQRCMSVGIDDFVTKPFTLQRMQAVVERWGTRSNH